MTKISITRALAELKVLPDRIKTASQALASTAVDVKVGRTSKVTRTAGVSLETFQENQLKAFQSLNDMIKRRERLKALIIKSNAVTTVNFLGETITVAVALTGLRPAYRGENFDLSSFRSFPDLAFKCLKPLPPANEGIIYRRDRLRLASHPSYRRD